MASLIKRNWKTGPAWYIQYYVGNQQRRIHASNNFQVAKEKLRRFEAAKAAGDDLPLPTRTFIPEIVAVYVQHIRQVKTAKSAQTDTYSLIDFLHNSLPRKRVHVRLNTVVTDIRWQRLKVEVHATDSNGAVTFKAPRVLITLPIGILQMPPENAGSIRFTPDVPEVRKAAMQLGSGPIVKAVLKFRKAFWESKSVARAARSDPGLRDAVFLHDLDAPFPTWWTARPLRIPVLTAWAGGPKALALAELSNQELQHAAIASLGELLGQRPSKLESLLEGFHVRDWASDPFARGAYSYVTVGGMQARRRLAKPIDNTLFFAGEATDTSGQASTVAGALSSGQRAAEEILNTF